jgi:hypothetical protein
MEDKKKKKITQNFGESLQEGIKSIITGITLPYTAYKENKEHTMRRKALENYISNKRGGSKVINQGTSQERLVTSVGQALPQNERLTNAIKGKDKFEVFSSNNWKKNYVTGGHNTKIDKDASRLYKPFLSISKVSSTLPQGKLPAGTTEIKKHRMTKTIVEKKRMMKTMIKKIPVGGKPSFSGQGTSTKAGHTALYGQGISSASEVAAKVGS